jgi:hypothetical protein
MPTPSRQEYVYLIGSRKFCWYKIGKAKNPRIRVSSLGILLPFRVALFGLWSTCKGLTTERMMHEKYAEYAINGEWFGIPLEKVVGILRDDQPFDSLLVYSVFDPQTYENARRLGVMADFSNIEVDKSIASKNVNSARQKVRTEFFAQWFQERGLEQCQENWNLHADEIHADWKQKYGHLTREQLAFCGGYVV